MSDTIASGAHTSNNAILASVTRLSRPHSSGGIVIERAAILAEGTISTAIVEWIIAHAGQPEAADATVSGRGLYGDRFSDGGQADRRTPPARYVLPPSALA